MKLYAIKNIETSEYVARYEIGNKSYSKNLPRFWLRRRTCETYFKGIDGPWHNFNDGNHVIVEMNVEEVE